MMVAVPATGQERTQRAATREMPVRFEVSRSRHAAHMQDRGMTQRAAISISAAVDAAGAVDIGSMRIQYDTIVPCPACDRRRDATRTTMRRGAVVERGPAEMAGEAVRVRNRMMWSSDTASKMGNERSGVNRSGMRHAGSEPRRGADMRHGTGSKMRGGCNVGRGMRGEMRGGSDRGDRTSNGMGNGVRNPARLLCRGSSADRQS
jgi:hypothetical protein